MARTVNERPDAVAALAEVFREYGYEGASLSVIAARTGLGKGSLYHFFPGGKEEMAGAVLAEIEGWFERAVYAPLREEADAPAAIRRMFRETDAYFRSGRRVCLVGAFALGEVRDRFAARIDGYFAAWRDALAGALRRAGHGEPEEAAEHVVSAIQGALVLARAVDDPAVFVRALRRLETGLGLPAPGA
ncbi:TetR/AcrR family transcriptional regulator [Methylobacterium oxalidis]|uniref:TetR family transcriptional regulator n=1 Tax=Methylobacterium oxalidis TaxID=944322 RepID=A0A512J4S3_9HYPH|nr:TetR/AcrR family transcriptional regulator [Methylobacterium oxalidis]GEP04966.1 TetR family transcriptional regulator [Methylobacterium oxalidis]GJE32357.1 putative HTH-type transcriptional regulator YxaF [Methylobacterium oxalidis]GLS63703.1 TetR family transcriptional regulator [Methylobacterium oxalidis]